MTGMFTDLRFALRGFIRQPGFTTVAILTLALGIGGGTALYSVVHAVLLRPLPYEEPDRLVRVQARNSYPDMADWVEQNRTLVTFGGYGFWQVDLTGVEEPERIEGSVVTGELFRLLGVETALGRVLLPDDDRLGGEPVVLLSDGFWRRRMGADPDVLGKTVSLGGVPYTVVGVMPPEFRLAQSQAELWATCWVVFPESTGARGVHNLVAIGRLEDGVTMAQAQSDMDGIAKRLEELYPDENTDRRFVLAPLKDSVVQDARTALLILFGAVGFVLAIACANAANLLLARAANRRREISIRTALGAGRARLTHQLITEAVLLSVAGGAVGLFLAYGLTEVFLALAPETIPRLQEVAFDAGVLGFTFAVSLVSGILFGMAPVLQALRADVSYSLREGERTGSGTTSILFRKALIVSEVALAVVLLIGAGLLLRSFLGLQQVDPGFRTDNVLTMNFNLPANTYRNISKRTVFFEQVLEAVGALPGVESVAATTDLPFGTGEIAHNLAIEGRPMAEGTEPETNYRGVSPEYFRVMQIPLLEGRGFTVQDREGAQPVAVINEEMVRQFFEGESPIGRRIRWARRDDVRWLTIVGVVGDVRPHGLDTEELRAVYVPFMQEQDWWRTWMNVVVAAGAEPGSLAGAVKHAVAEIDPNIPVADILPMERLLDESATERRFNMLLLSSFALVALTLAAVGIYGVLSYTVARRTNEIGIRMALGAGRAQVLRMVIRQGLSVGLFGLALGILMALVLTRLMSSLLYQLSPTDPATYLAIAVILSAVMLAACFVPARRATKVDPMIALRYE